MRFFDQFTKTVSLSKRGTKRINPSVPELVSGGIESHMTSRLL